MNMPGHWRLIFENLDEVDSGEVIFREDGEVIGTWTRVDDLFFTFMPNGATSHLFFEPRLGLLVFKILDWHAAQQAVVG